MRRMPLPSSCPEDRTLPTNGMATIGLITAGPARPIEGFKAGLKELGFVEGQSVRFEQRAANGDLGRLPTFATELVRLSDDLIAVIGAVTARVVKACRSFSRWVVFVASTARSL